MEEFEKQYIEADTQAQRNHDHGDHIAALHRKDSLGYLTQDTRIFKCVSPSIHCPCKRCHFRRMETGLRMAFKELDARK